MPPILIVAAALAIEAGVGFPAPVFRAVRHPVVWIGALIGVLDRRLNADADPPVAGRGWGAAAVAILLVATVIPCVLLQQVLTGVGGGLVVAVLASTLLAQRSLWEHVRAVEHALRDRGLDGGREAVARIVGRNPAVLDEAGVARAAIESLAENFSDGVVAPAFWCAVAGLPGIAAYKAVNTADSMIGHRSARHEAFGWAAARLDDVVNLPASRLSVVWLVLAAAIQPGAHPLPAVRAVVRDAGKHRSPNAGWSEAAMAGALGLRLAGPRVYGMERVEDSWMGDGREVATGDDIGRALGLYRTACVIQFIVVAVAAVFIARG